MDIFLQSHRLGRRGTLNITEISIKKPQRTSEQIGIMALHLRNAKRDQGPLEPWLELPFENLSWTR
jgi:hypothetical protein